MTTIGVSGQVFTNQQDVTDKANQFGYDTNSINVADDNTVSVSDSDGNQWLLGTWGGNYTPNFNVSSGGDPSSVSNLDTLTGNGANNFGIGVANGNNSTIFGIPWWIFLIAGGVALYVTHGFNDIFDEDDYGI